VPLQLAFHPCTTHHIRHITLEPSTFFIQNKFVMLIKQGWLVMEIDLATVTIKQEITQLIAGVMVLIPITLSL
jgi:hypothetical protein